MKFIQWLLKRFGYTAVKITDVHQYNETIDNQKTEIQDLITHDNDILQQLNEYKKHIEAKLKFDERKASIEKKQLFTSGYVEELHHIGIRMGGDVEAQIARISTDIFDRLDLEAIAVRRALPRGIIFHL